jgi:hypothetical protein
VIAWLLILSVPASIIFLVIWDVWRVERPSKEDGVSKFEFGSFVAVALSALFAGATFVFSNLYKPEDLVVSSRVVAHDQIASDHLDVSRVVTNAGQQPIVIENVLLVQNFGKNVNLESATDWKVAGSIWVRDVVTRLDGTIENMQDGTRLVTYSPTKVRINNLEVPGPSAPISSGSASLFVLAFSPAPIDLPVEGAILEMVAIQYYDKTGVMRRKVLPLGLMDWIHFGRRYNPAKESFARLLP